MGRKRKAASAATGQPEKQITKAEAVRRALGEGIDVPTEGARFIKERFGVVMTPSVFSTYKSQERSRAKKAGAKKARGKRKPVRPFVVKPAPQAANHSRPENMVEAVAAIKQLVSQYGANTVRGLVGLFE